LIGNGTMSPAAYDAMKQLNITHVYVGAEYSYQWEKNRKWDPLVFLSNPSFDLVKKTGNAYLFEVLYEKPKVPYEDSFEYTNVYDMGWEFLNAEWCQSRGSGYVSINSSYIYCGAHNLVITAKNERGLFYTNGIYRKIYIWDASNVALGFWIDATVGFSPPDALIICIYDTSWNQSICFTTPNSLYAEHNSTTVLPAPAGFFSYNVSDIWQKTYNSMLPTTFFITIQNIDFDGAENVGYVGDISVEIDV